MSNSGTYRSYQSALAGYGYDLLSKCVFAPVGGLEVLRAEAIAALDLDFGMHVLELGCGTGGLTRKLLERGALVTAVDWSERMLARARVRSPAATYELAEITLYAPKQRFERVVFGFVLHELEEELRQQALIIARNALAPGGSVVIIDHALPTAGLIPRAVSALVHGFEPSGAELPAPTATQ